MPTRINYLTVRKLMKAIYLRTEQIFYFRTYTKYIVTIQYIYIL